MTVLHHRSAWLCAACCLALTAPSAIAQSPFGPAPLPARPADVASIDAIIVAAFEAMSGEAGVARDWDRFRSLFKPSAQFITAPSAQGGAGFRLNPRSLEEIIQSMDGWLAENTLYEGPVHTVTEQFGRIAHAFVTYEARRAADAAEPSGRGISSFQLMHDGARWWIVNWFWVGEREGDPIPKKYLPME